MKAAIWPSNSLTDFCKATTPKVFCSAWLSLSCDESKLLTPNALVMPSANVWPGLFGIWKRLVVLPKIVATRVSLVDHGRRVAEEIALLGAIVDRVAAGGRIFDAEVAGEAAAGEEIFRGCRPAAVFEARRDRAEAAAIDADAAALFERVAALVWISTTPEVRSPNCAGSAPVISARLPMNLLSRTWPKPEMPSGKVMPLMRYCTLPCSLRTWISPLAAESCVTPGACSSTLSIEPSLPCGRLSMNARFMSKLLAPKRGDRLSRAMSNCVFCPASTALGSGRGAAGAVAGRRSVGTGLRRGGAGRWPAPRFPAAPHLETGPARPMKERTAAQNSTATCDGRRKST